MCRNGNLTGGKSGFLSYFFIATVTRATVSSFTVDLKLDFRIDFYSLSNSVCRASIYLNDPQKRKNKIHLQVHGFVEFRVEIVVFGFS